MREMLRFWQRRQEDLATAQEYAGHQSEALILRLLGQLAIPIEAALDDESEYTGDGDEYA